jgi:hypothetical protein
LINRSAVFETAANIAASYFEEAVMKGVLAALVGIMLMTAVSARICQCGEPKLLADKLDAKVITRGLPISNAHTRKSGEGKVKKVWEIQGQTGHFEIIGNDQSNADVVAWKCSEFDKQGKRISPSSPQHFCYRLFIKVLGSVVDRPEELARSLLSKAKGSDHPAAFEQLGKISIETDGQFYFLRNGNK